MALLNTLLHRYKHKLFYHSAVRFYVTLIEKEFTVVPFCNVVINLPFNVSINPLDVHKYKDCDKVILRILSDTESFPPQLQYTYDHENVNISGNFKEPMDNVTCKIAAPVKANLNITTKNNGHIDLSDFNGESIFLKSHSGNITASKCHCNEVLIVSSTGNILCKNVIQAAKIYLKTQKYGNITAGRLQGLDLTVETENGNIKTESSYCSNSTFLSDAGNLNLQNAHKDCKVIIKKAGDLNITGFDGTLHADINKGAASIQLSRILGKSKIRIGGSSSLNMKLSEACLEDTCFKIIARDVQIDNNINKNKCVVDEHNTFLNPKSEIDVVIDGKETAVKIEVASWMDMFNLTLPTNRECA